MNIWDDVSTPADEWDSVSTTEDQWNAVSQPEQATVSPQIQMNVPRNAALPRFTTGGEAPVEDFTPEPIKPLSDEEMKMADLSPTGTEVGREVAGIASGRTIAAGAQRLLSAGKRFISKEQQKVAPVSVSPEKTALKAQQTKREAEMHGMAAEMLDPTWYNSEAIQTKLSQIEGKDPDLANSFKFGGITGASDILTFKAFLSGDDNAKNIAMQTQKQVREAGGKRQKAAEAKKGILGKAENVLNATAEMTNMLATGGLKAAIPVVGPVLSSSMWAMQGAGDIITQAKEQGADDDTALGYGVLGGIVYAGVENLQLGQLLNTGAKKAVQGTVKKKLAKLLLEKGKDYFKEVAEEGIQGVVVEDAIISALKDSGIKVDDETKRKVEAFKDNVIPALGPMGILSLVGLGAGAAGMRSDRVAPQTTPQAVPQGKILSDFQLTPETYYQKPEAERLQIFDQLSPAEQERVVVEGEAYAQGAGEGTAKTGAEEGPAGTGSGQVRVLGDEENRVGTEETFEVKDPDYRKKITDLAKSLQTIKDKKMVQQEIEKLTPEEAKDLLKVQSGLPKVDVSKIPGEELEEVSAYGKEGRLIGGRKFPGGAIPEASRKNRGLALDYNKDLEALGPKIQEEHGVEGVTYGGVQMGYKSPKKTVEPTMTFRDEYTGSNINVTKAGGAKQLQARIKEVRAADPKKTAEGIAKIVGGLKPSGETTVMARAVGAGKYEQEKIYSFKTDDGITVTIKPTDTVKSVQSYIDRKRGTNEQNAKAADQKTETVLKPKEPSVPSTPPPKLANKTQMGESQGAVNRYIKKGDTTSPEGQEAHAMITDLVTRANPNDLADATGMDVKQATKGVADIKSGKESEEAVKIRDTFAANMVFGQSVDDVIKEITQPRDADGNVMFAKGKNIPVRIDDNGDMFIDNYDDIPMSKWDEISRYMKSKGYDYKGGKDAKNLFSSMYGNRRIASDQKNAIKSVYGIKDKNKAVTKKTYENPLTQLTTPKKEFESVEITESPSRGFLLPDGRYLGIGSGNDHRYINGMVDFEGEYEKKYYSGSGPGLTDKMYRIMEETGAIRFIPESDSFQFKTEPTKDQVKAIGRYVKENGSAEVEFKNGKSNTYTKETLYQLEDDISGGRIQFAKQKVTAQSLINSKDLQGDLNKMFGNIPEARLEELDNGAEFKSDRERKNYELANKYQADLEYAASNGFIEETQTLLDNYRRDLSGTRREPVNPKPREITDTEREQLSGVDRVIIERKGDMAFVWLEKGNDVKTPKVAWSEKSLSKIIGPGLAKEVVGGRFQDNYKSNIMKGKTYNLITSEHIKDYLNGELKTRAQEHEEANSTRIIRGDIKYAKQKDQTSTPEFKKWFTGSKVVDENENPLVVFHGAKGGDIKKFSTEKINENFTSRMGRGFYFTDNTKAADYYAEKTEGASNPSILPVYLSLKNPLIIKSISEYRAAISSAKERLTGGNRKKLDDIGGKDGNEILAMVGYDGVIDKSTGGMSEIVAFSPTQIKSATGNRGTFDANNPDIRYAKGGKGETGNNEPLPKKDETGRQGNEAGRRRPSAGTEDTQGDTQTKEPKAPYLQKKRNYALERVVRKVYVGEDPNYEAITIAELSPEQKQVMDAFSELTGETVVPVEIDNDEIYKKFDFSIDGIREADRSYINIKSQRPLLWVAYHEWYHGLADEEKQFISDAIEYTDEGLAESANDHEEFMADIAGEILSRQDALEYMARENEGMLRSILNKLIKAINDLTAKARELIVGNPNIKPEFDRYIKNAEQVRDRLNEVLKNRTGTTETDIAFAKGDQTKTEAFKKWFADSKVVDENGDPLVVFHGTPDATFNEFRSDQFFSADPNYANKYTTSSSASSSFYGVRDNSPAVLPVYLSIKNPFDTRIKSNEKIYNEKFYGKYGNGSKLTERGLPDWVEARDLVEFLKSNPQYGKFDGILIDEGADRSGIRPMSYMPFSPTQIKSATGNRGTFDPENPDIRFAKQRREPQKPREREAIVSPDVEELTGQNQSINTTYYQINDLQKKRNELKRKLGKVSNATLDERIRIAEEISRLDELNRDKVIAAIYDYADRIGLRAERYNMVDRLMKSSKGKTGLMRAVEIMDNVLERKQHSRFMDAAKRAVQDAYVYLNRISGSTRATTDLETNRALRDYLVELTGGTEEEQRKAQMMATYYNEYGSKDLKQNRDKFVSELGEDVVQWIEGETTGPLPQGAQRLIKALASKGLDGLSNTQLVRVVNDLRNLRKEGRTQRQVQEEIQRESFNRDTQKIAEVINSNSEAKPESRAQRAFKSPEETEKDKKKRGFKPGDIEYDLSDSERIIQKMAGDRGRSLFKRTVFDPLYKADSEKKLGTKKTLKWYEESHKDPDTGKTIKMSEVRQPLMDITVEKIENGETVQSETPITIAQAMKFYAHSLNPNQREHLIWTIMEPSKKATAQARQEENDGKRAIAEGVIDKVVNTLPEKYKQMVRNTWNFYETTQYDRINEVFSKEHGIDMPKSKYYFPIRSLQLDRPGGAIEADLLARAGAKAGVSKGFTKGRVASMAALGNTDYFDDLVSNILQTEHYIAFNDAVKKVSKVINNPDVKNAMKNFSQAGYNAIDDWLKALAYGRMNYGTTDAWYDKAVRVLRNNYAVWTLGFNPTSVMMQTASLARGTSQVGPKYVAQSISKMIREGIGKFDERINSLSPQQESRIQNYEQGIREWVENDISKTIVGDLKTPNAVYNFLRDKAMLPMGVVDKFVSNIIWDAKYQQSLDKGMSQEDAVYEADKVVRQTQSGGGLLASNKFQRGPEWQRMYTQFLSDPAKGLNQLIEMKNHFKEMDPKERAYIIALGVVTPAIMEYMIRNFRLPWEEPEEVFKGAVSSIVSAIPLFGMLFDTIATVGMDTIKKSRGVPVDKGPYSYLTDIDVPLFSSIGDIAKGITRGDLTQIGQGIGAGIGIPAGGPALRTIKNANVAIEHGNARYFIASKKKVNTEFQQVLQAKKSSPGPNMTQEQVQKQRDWAEKQMSKWSDAKKKEFEEFRMAENKIRIKEKIKQRNLPKDQ